MPSLFSPRSSRLLSPFVPPTAFAARPALLLRPPPLCSFSPTLSPAFFPSRRRRFSLLLRAAPVGISGQGCKRGDADRETNMRTHTPQQHSLGRLSHTKRNHHTTDQTTTTTALFNFYIFDHVFRALAPTATPIPASGASTGRRVKGGLRPGAPARARAWTEKERDQRQTPVTFPPVPARRLIFFRSPPLPGPP